MASKYVKDTTWAFFVANWTASRLINTENLFANEAVQRDLGTLEEWVTMHPMGATESQVSMGAPGSRRWREEGTIAFVAYVPSGTGVNRAETLADALQTLFRGKQITDGAGGPAITFEAVNPPDTGFPASMSGNGGNWFGYAVHAQYSTDICD